MISLQNKLHFETLKSYVCKYDLLVDILIKKVWIDLISYIFRSPRARMLECILFSLQATSLYGTIIRQILFKFNTTNLFLKFLHGWKLFHIVLHIDVSLVMHDKSFSIMYSYKDIKSTATNDDQYFVFEDLLYQVKGIAVCYILNRIIVYACFPSEYWRHFYASDVAYNHLCFSSKKYQSQEFIPG